MVTIAHGDRKAITDISQEGAKLRTITLEEHFVSLGFIAGPGRGFIEQLRSRSVRGDRIFEQLQDVGGGRIAEMDAAGIDMQVLSLNAPGIEQADVAEQVAIARESNDFLSDVDPVLGRAFPSSTNSASAVLAISFVSAAAFAPTTTMDVWRLVHL
jgi:hypothetical protein